ncbi:ATP-binding protein, partial [Candidatus Micrarchaeota archaeon]|nr:ATP-binding protein [Candidatus Micrarchaeota archaeon]
ALNEKTKEILFAEVKWSDLDEKKASTLLAGLKEKARKVEWNNGERKEHYTIIARKLIQKNHPEKNTVFLDLGDF